MRLFRGSASRLNSKCRQDSADEGKREQIGRSCEDLIVIVFRNRNEYVRYAKHTRRHSWNENIRLHCTLGGCPMRARVTESKIKTMGTPCTSHLRQRTSSLHRNKRPRYSRVEAHRRVPQNRVMKPPYKSALLALAAKNAEQTPTLRVFYTAAVTLRKVYRLSDVMASPSRYAAASN
jgi:hypothetical protein